MWGLICGGPEGFLNQYDKMAGEAEAWQDWHEWLDYAPLRLIVMTRWADWIRATYPAVVAEHRPTDVYGAIVPSDDRGSGRPNHLANSFRFHRPLLLFNATMDAIAAAAAFALTRLWVRRSAVRPLDDAGVRHDAFCGVAPGLAAGLVLWFNPAILMDAYAWPTWDAWVVPFFLLCALAASVDAWFTAGVVLGVGAMFKGQQLAVAPALAAWAIVASGPRAMFRCVAGAAIAVGLIAAPWTMTYIAPDTLTQLRTVQQRTEFWNWPADLFAVPREMDWPALIWAAGIGFAVTAGVLVQRLRPRPPAIAIDDSPVLSRTASFGTWARGRVARSIVAAVIVAIAVAWPWSQARHRGEATTGALLALMLAAMVVWARIGRWAWLAVGAVGAALVGAPLLFSGSTAWWVCGFHFGTIQFGEMIYGPASNLPGIFELQFNWPADINAIALTIP